VRSAEPLPLLELFDRLRGIGGRLVRCGDGVSVEALGITPEIEASVKAHQSDLLLLVPEPEPDKGERWQHYFDGAFECSKDKAWAESYATAQVKREAWEKSLDEGPTDEAFQRELDALEEDGKAS